MKYSNLSLKELHQLLETKQLTPSQLAQEIVEKIEHDATNKSLITFPKAELLAQAKILDQQAIGPSLLWGIPYVAKDNFSTKGLRTTAGTKMLKDFVPPYSSHIIDKLSETGALLAGKANMDELGMGGTGLSSGFGPLYHPFNRNHLVGGSSSGSAYVVAKGLVPYALGTDTGDSIRKPASFVGVVGFKPTYGSLSRYGLIPYAPSLDHPGFFTRTVEEAAILADASFDHDPRDFTSLKLPKQNFLKQLPSLPQKLTFGYLKQVQENLPPTLKRKYEKLYQQLKAQGFEVKAVTFPQELLEVLPSIYMMISFTEAVSTHANLSGIHFGTQESGNDYVEMITKARTKNFGPVVRRRFLIGSLNLKQENQELYMNKAKKVRRLIVEELDKIYQKIDVLLLPPATSGAPKISESVEYETEPDQFAFLNDILILSNFNGMPSITIPFTEDPVTKLPIGININTKPTTDLLTLQAAHYLEQLINKSHF